MSACNSQPIVDEEKGEKVGANIKAVHDLEAMFVESYNKQDFAKAASPYGDKGQLYPPGKKVKIGQHEIADGMKGVYDSGAVKLECEIAEVRAIGENEVLEVARYTFLDKDGNKARYGTWMVNWYKLGDTLVIRYRVVQNE